MSLTRANVEAITIQRVGGFLTAAGLDGTTVGGTNASLNDPIGFAVRAVGGTVSAPTLVTDTDVATVGATSYDQFFDRIELRALETALNNYVLVNTTAGPLKTEAGALAERLEKRALALRTAIETRYGVLVPAAAPYVGGITDSGKTAVEDDTDRVVPAFGKDTGKRD